MRRKRKDEYHLLVAQNFLGNISLTGNHDDTKLRMFNTPGYKIKEKKVENMSIPVMEEASLVKFDLQSSEAELRVVATAPEIIPGKILESPVAEDPFSQSFPSCNFPKSHRHRSSRTPTSIIRRFVKILSSDDVISTRESRIDQEHIPLTTRSTKDDRRLRRDSFGSNGRPHSPNSDSHFLFFRKIRTSIAKGERSYLCSPSTFGPFAVVTHFSLFTNERHGKLNRSHSTLATSVERMRHISQCSMDELKPYDFHDDEMEISFGYLFGGRRGVSPCGAISTIRRSDRRESNHVDSCAKMTDGETSDTLGTMISLATKDPSFEPDEIEWDEPAAESYSPSIFEDIEASKKAVIRLPSYIGVTLQYSKPDVMKANMNQAFSDKFPKINLTYSKFKSITKEIVTIAKKCNVDLSTIAQGLVFFEKIVHKGLISKSNRKVVAGASILVALKLNDYAKEHIKLFLDNSTSLLRVPRKEFIALEIPLCAALHFELRSASEHVDMHYQKLLISYG